MPLDQLVCAKGMPEMTTDRPQNRAGVGIDLSAAAGHQISARCRDIFEQRRMTGMFLFPLRPSDRILCAYHEDWTGLPTGAWLISSRQQRSYHDLNALSICRAVPLSFWRPPRRAAPINRQPAPPENAWAGRQKGKGIFSITFPCRVHPAANKEVHARHYCLIRHRSGKSSHHH